MAFGITDHINGCGQQRMNRCFPSMQAACNERLRVMALPVVHRDGVKLYDWGARGMITEQCTKYGAARPNPGYFGVERDPHTLLCPEPTPIPVPTPEPSPTPTPGDCSYTHFNLVWLCSQPSKPGCLDGRDWGRPGIVHINRDGKPICDRRQCVRAFLTAVLFNDREKIEAGHACFPGPIPEGSWGQAPNPGMQYDCGHPWGEGWNNGSCNIDFAARNTFRLDAFGVSGTSSMTSDWR